MSFSREIVHARKNAREKNLTIYVKLHLTQTPEKLIPYAVIKIFLHDFARHVRLEEGVISMAAKKKAR